MPSEHPVEASDEPRLCLVSGMYMCEACLDGAGGECHTPGCILWINRAPDLAIRDTIIDCGGKIEVLVSRLDELLELERKGVELNEEERGTLARGLANTGGDDAGRASR